MASTVTLKQPLIPEELDSYKKIFNQLDDEQLSIITGDKLKPLFIKSKIPTDKLAVIWELADYDNKGFLTFDQFAICCRLTGFLQFNNNNLSRELTSEDYQLFYKIADFSGNFIPQQQLNRQSSFMINRQTSTNSLQSNSNINEIPQPTIQEINQFSQLFDSYSNGNSVISGENARSIFQKSKLPTQALVEIWTLADQNDVGSLDKPQFVVAMYLVQLLMNNKIGLPLPTVLPATIWSTVRQHVSPVNPSVSSQSIGSFQQPMKIQSPLQRNLTNNSLNTPVENWVLTPEKCNTFDTIFDSLDKNHTKKLGTDVLVPYFLESGLSQDVLAVIWDLADIQNNAEFSSVEFSIAMFLIQKTNAGVELPDIVPQSLLKSSIENHQKKNNATNVNSASIPSRDTKPLFENSNNNPLNDLLTLDNRSFSPSGQQQQHTLATVGGSSNSTGNSFTQPVPLATNTINNNVTPIKKFKPSSTFGQSIIPEEPPQIQQPPTVSSPSATNGGTSSPLRYNFTSTLPAVPNFATLSSPSNSRQVSTTGNESAMALSNATTEVANLSTQVRSLSNQTKIVQDRKARAEQELAKITATKVTIENRLSSLRQAFNTESALSEQAEQQALDLQKETDMLQQELQVLETNYQTVKTQHETTNNSLNNLLQENANLKQRIADINVQTENLNKDLESKKQEILKQEGLVSVNGKQLEVSEINSNNLQNEISLIGQHIATFLTKKGELDQYGETLAQQHQVMNDKHKDLEEGFQNLQIRQQDLEAKTAEIEKQEQIYNENVQRLQELFNDFQQQQKILEEERQILEENEMKLEQDRNDYLNRVQDFATQDFDLPSDSLKQANSVSEINEKELNVAKESSETQLTDAKTDVSSNLQQLTEAHEEKLIHETTKMDDVPVHASTSSSVVNNAAQSEIVPKTEEITKDSSIPVDTGIPGGFENEVDLTNKTIVDQHSIEAAAEQIQEIPNTPPITNKDELDKQIREENASFNSSIQSSLKLDNALEKENEKEKEKNLIGLPISGPTTEEFPPIKELDIAESDSSDEESDDEVEDSVNGTANASKPIAAFAQGSSFSSVSAPVTTATATTPSTSALPKEFDQFDDLQPAQNDDDEFSGLEAAQVIEEDEDENDEDSEDQFHDTNENTAFSQTQGTTKPTNEWDEMFESLDKQPQQHMTPVETIQQQQISSSNNIAISPKDLAIEELTDMGFSEEASKEALERFNWHLESAAQYLVNKN